ncbi:type II toxin-antitoxin system VapC family toxin [Arthrobacter sp. A5]|uniref:type II toxin-antitoxin system VapC family toxin n=1 Tax=Arthrobacter sp. A5 TaxID=576926 RepID=UPI003DA9A4CB
MSSSWPAARRFLVDSNVLLDVALQDADWSSWSEDAMAEPLRTGTVAINPLIYAEVSVGYKRIESLDAALPEELFARLPIPYQAGFLAGKAFAQYRSRGGLKRAPLPDFYIGAHAAVSGLTLITRDSRRYRAYFPTVELICPPTENHT